jgi:hypothetical protein
MGQKTLSGGGVVMTMVQLDVVVSLALPEESVTWAVKEKVPA